MREVYCLLLIQYTYILKYDKDTLDTIQSSQDVLLNSRLVKKRPASAFSSQQVNVSRAISLAARKDGAGQVKPKTCSDNEWVRMWIAISASILYPTWLNLEVTRSRHFQQRNRRNSTSLQQLFNWSCWQLLTNLPSDLSISLHVQRWSSDNTWIFIKYEWREQKWTYSISCWER